MDNQVTFFKKNYQNCDVILFAVAVEKGFALKKLKVWKNIHESSLRKSKTITHSLTIMKWMILITKLWFAFFSVNIFFNKRITIFRGRLTFGKIGTTTYYYKTTIILCLLTLLFKSKHKNVVGGCIDVVVFVKVTYETLFCVDIY